MKKIFVLMAIMVLALAISVSAAKPVKDDCATIQDGTILSSGGDVVTTGYTDGYNYQAHMYNGDYYQDGSNLIMKWNDAWLSNKDCDADNTLDRHYGFETYIGSGAWLTNHWTNTYEMPVEDAEPIMCYQDYFIKIVAAPADATKENGMWYNADGMPLGAVIWNEFIIIQENWYDSCDEEGSYTMHESMPGFGTW